MKVFPRSSVILAVLASSALAFSVQAEQFESVPITGSLPAYVPRGVDTSPVNVVVLLPGDPVAVVQKNAGRLLTRAEKDAVKAQRQAEQALVQPQIEAQGGKVVATYQSALNGLKVQIARNQVSGLQAIPGVTSVKPVGTYELNNAVSVPFIGAPAVWKGPPSNRGESVKIAIIDTGIDYTHANFGGPGTVAAFNTAFANSTAPADPALFGPLAPKVKGGIDLVGDAYTGGNTPVPDPNPLDCNGHGSHTAGTAAGFGVSADGTTYNSNYGPSIYTPHAFAIGPGVAPAAKLYAVRVFGCSGSTNVVSEAIDWAVDNDMDVISMSLGADWGPADNSESVAIANASAAGVLVISASGNSGFTPYIASSPAASEGAIGVAAMDSSAGYPGATLTMTGNPTPVVVQNSNDAAFASGTTLPVVVLRNGDGTVSLGCNESEYVDALITGALVVTQRGICARVLRAQLGFKHGAAAVVMINNAASYPVFEGDIPALTGGGLVTIPFFGALPSDLTALSGPTGGPAPASATENNAGIIPNPAFRLAASFSSAGPRYGDSALRPNVTAPGVAIFSTAIGTGTGRVAESGTSMATPHVAGVAALVKKADTAWSVADQRAAIIQTGSPTAMLDYSPRVEGSGLVQPFGAVNTQAVVRTAGNALSYGFADLLSDFHGNLGATLHNYSKSKATFNVSVTQVNGATGVTVNAPSTLTVNGNGDTNFNVGLNVPAASIPGTHTAGGACCLFSEIGGFLTLTPTTSKVNNGVALTVPYYFVPRSRSSMSATASAFGPTTGPGTFTVSNAAGVPRSGTPDFYSTGLSIAAPQGIPYADTRAVGVKALSGGAVMVFAVNTFDRFSNATPSEWDIYIDSTGDGVPDYVLVGANGKFFTTAAVAQNVLTAALIKLSNNAVVSLRLADVATDNSTILLPVTSSALGVTAGNPRIQYWENHFSGTTGDGASMPGSGKFNAFTPALTVTYAGGAIAPGGSANGTINVNAAEWAATPPQGLMMVYPDNVAGASQAQLIPAGP